MGVPTGYVHIEAPLSRSASAFGAVDEVDVAFGAASGAAVGGSSATATTVTEKTERVVRQAYEHNHQGEAAYSNTFKGAAGARAYSSRSGGLDNIDDGDDQQPVQLNDTSAPGSSQIGAVLIRPETPRGQGDASDPVLTIFHTLRFNRKILFSLLCQISFILINIDNHFYLVFIASNTHV